MKLSIFAVTIIGAVLATVNANPQPQKPIKMRADDRPLERELRASVISKSLIKLWDFEPFWIALKFMWIISEDGCEDDWLGRWAEVRCKTGDAADWLGATSCIPEGNMCDNNYDCKDGSDEEGCPMPDFEEYVSFPLSASVFK